MLAWIIALILFGCLLGAFTKLRQLSKELKAFENYEIDVAVYDVLGDVVCGGFAMPIRQGYAREIYLICSGGFMSIYAANNIARAVRRLGRRGNTGLSGIICNSNGDEKLEMEVLPEFARRLGSKFIQFVPRSPIIQACEAEGRTVLEHSPKSEEAKIFQELARKVMENDSRVIPTPVDELSELEEMYRRHLYK
ncbi:MAG: hypothetical protein U9O85_01035 [Euryarchaeota archaeon]|nr:hypothetical protein [Euryarchaeota archaeon]